MLQLPENIIDTSGLKQPVLVIVIDTEEEFNWGAALERSSTSIKNIAHQEKAHTLFSKYNIKPTYVIDYPVANQPDGVKPLKELLNDNLCDIGSHLHPWVNPPFDEAVNNYNSYPGNLTYEYEYKKLKVLTETIEKNFNVRPVIYKAGRYGVGENTSDILTKLGYIIDCSVVPNTDFSHEEGPDFSHLPDQPYGFANNKILEVPLSVDYVGLLSSGGSRLYDNIHRSFFSKIRIASIFSRSGIFERIRLSPEGHSFNDLKRLTLNMMKQSNKVFCLTYHSSSLMPGCSPYVKNNNDLYYFLDTLDQYLSFFSNDLGGIFSTLVDLKSDISTGK